MDFNNVNKLVFFVLPIKVLLLLLLLLFVGEVESVL